MDAPPFARFTGYKWIFLKPLASVIGLKRTNVRLFIRFSPWNGFLPARLPVLQGGNQFIHLAGSHQERPRTVKFGHVACHLFRIGAYRLDPA